MSELYSRWQNAHKDLGLAEGIVDLFEAQLKEANDTIRRTCNLGVSGVVLLEKQLKQRDALLDECEKYLHHSLPEQHCDSMKHSDYKCNCGLERLLDKIQNRNKP